ncbi:hypothetical protein M0811_14714 [Anaeramoeba ignava]|uniref:Uncharacterized protein n=1 Tax=Anaeramoeba ignava TaxID=1746090 RepID=A0A9Q0RFD7_ANAIG|nr:hypothetical protein M0811_14714 [Anaeramoeba ignava]
MNFSFSIGGFQKLGKTGTIICCLIFTAAIVIPSVVVASKDKDASNTSGFCDKPLWPWILVFNMVLVYFFLSNTLSQLLGQDSPIVRILGLISLLAFFFMIAWSIIGLVWATRSGMKDWCGKLYDVTLGDSILWISLMGLCSILICVAAIFFGSAINRFKAGGAAF